MKRFAPIVVVLGLCALPAAHGDAIQLTSIAVRHAMTPIGSLPTKADLESLFPQPVSQLAAIALDGNEDFGVRLRAVRALPEFCLPNCWGTPAHNALVTVLGSPVPNDPGKTILLERAAIEALGIAKSRDTRDVDRLVSFLGHASRDIRATTAFALRDLCLPAAIVPLRNRYNVEPVMQVRLAISAALRDLDTCTN
jgi:hypothetical protein